MSDINCNVGIVNTGQTCVPVMKVAKKIIVVQTYNSLGVLNEIDLTAGPFNDAYLALRINDTDASKRWYPLPSMKNITDVRAASDAETFNDGVKIITQQGVRAFMGLILASDAPPQMIKKILSMRGLGVSIFVVDKEGNLIGRTGSSATKFAPIQLEADSLDAILEKSQDKTIQKIQVSFDINISENDGNLRMIQSTEAPWNISGAKGLVDVSSTVVVVDTVLDRFTVTLNTDGGTPLNPGQMQGLVVADFISASTATPGKVWDITAAADKTITSAAEITPGTYLIILSAPVTDEDVLQLFALKAGYGFSAVKANTFVMS